MKEQERDQPKNAEPISLYPLKPAEALKGLMAVKPEPKQKAVKARKKPAKRRQ